MKIAAVHSTAHPLKMEGNLQNMERRLEIMSGQHVAIAYFPEFSVSGVIASSAMLQTYIPYHQSTIQALMALSARVKIPFTAGLPMPCEKGWTIAQLFLFQGAIIGRYDKMIPGPTERKTYCMGDTSRVVHAGGIVTGQQLCYEVHYPEVAMIQQRQGAQLLCYSMASPRETSREKMDRLLPLLSARAMDNSCFVVVCNLSGTTASGKRMSGMSAVLSPRGAVLASACEGDQEYCVCDIDLHQIENIQRSAMGYFAGYRRWNWLKEQIDELSI